MSISDIYLLSPFRGLNIGVFSALQSAAIDLERKLAAQNLKKDLEKRPQRETLVERKRLITYYIRAAVGLLIGL